AEGTLSLLTLRCVQLAHQQCQPLQHVSDTLQCLTVHSHCCYCGPPTIEATSCAKEAARTGARRQLRWTMGVWCALMVVAMWSTPSRAAEFRIAVGVDPDTLDPVQLTTTTVGN